jgi:hypothetical protein
MAKKSKKRLLDKWYIRKMGDNHVLFGWECHAARWIADRILWQSACHHKGQLTYLYVCENRSYKVTNRQGPDDLWRL